MPSQLAPKAGYIYVAHNPRNGPNTYKVGKTPRTVQTRMNELTAAPGVLD